MRCPGCLLPILFTLAHANTFKVFHNTFDPAVFGTTGGAHLNATGDGYVDALSICIRFQVHYTTAHLNMTYCQFLQVIFVHFQFANLAGNDDKWRWRSVVYRIYDVKTNRKLLEATAGMYISLFLFGYPVAKNTYSGYILDDNGEYSIYKPRQWNHLCFAWSSKGKSKVVLVNNETSCINVHISEIR